PVDGLAPRSGGSLVAQCRDRVEPRGCYSRVFGRSRPRDQRERGLTSIRNFVCDPKRGGLARGLSATSFLLDAYHAPEDGTAVDLALATRPAPGASPPRFAAPGNF